MMLASSLGTSAQSTQKYYYVKAPCDLVSGSDADGSTWEKAISLNDALVKASSGSTIFVKGYTVEQSTDNTFFYTVPDSNGFRLPSGVRVYGGFKGTEDNLEARVSQLDDPSEQVRQTDGDLSQMLYRSVLTGDVLGNDTLSTTAIIYPENATRADNAHHVVTMSLSPETGHSNANNEPTVLNGFYVTGGNANATNSADVATGNGYGGGIYVDASSQDGRTTERRYDISRCFVTCNYAQRGAGIYISPRVSQRSDVAMRRVRYNTIYNNVGGERGSDNNMGAGIWAEGTSTIVNNMVYCNTGGGLRVSEKANVVGNTISRNTVAGIDVVNADANSEVNIYNTVVWQNERLSKLTPPTFYNCGLYNTRSYGYDGEDNVVVSEQNTSTVSSPYFRMPATITGYDTSFDWLQTGYPQWSYAIGAQSVLLASGDDSHYDTSVGELSLDGNKRIDGVHAIDIGAYSYLRIDISRRRYVKPAEDGGCDEVDENGVLHDGKSWELAYANPQTAIDELAQTPGQRGEVFIKAGVYTPKRRSEFGGDHSFIMRDGINVYGGFLGTEDEVYKRDDWYDDENYYYGNRSLEYPWKFKQATILRADAFNPDQVEWSVEAKQWSYSSGSRHVVWFAPSPGDDYVEGGFSMSTILNGVTIEGGLIISQTEVSASDISLPTSRYSQFSGAGVYMDGANANLQDCVVRYCNTSAVGKGGAIYCHNGRIDQCLVYNNLSGEGGGVYVEGAGLMMRSIVSNNKANNGGGIYLNHGNGLSRGRVIVAMSVIANNENMLNGAIYANHGGTLIHNTIVNNYTSRPTDDAEGDRASRTGGLFVDGYSIAVNNIIWNNRLMQFDDYGKNADASSQAQMYVSNAKVENVRFYNNAMSSPNYSVWNNVFQSGTYEMSTDVVDGYFQLNEDASSTQYKTTDAIKSTMGLQSHWTTVDYYWPLVRGSNLSHQGLPLWLFPSQVPLRPDADICGNAYEETPAIGAHYVERTDFRMACLKNADRSGDILRIYVDNDASTSAGKGSSWADASLSLQEALDMFGTMYVGGEISTRNLRFENPADYEGEDFVFIEDNTQFEIYLREGSYYPTYAYNNNPNSVSIRIPATECPLRIVGGFPSFSKNDNPTDADRAPMIYRTMFDGDYFVGSIEGRANHVVRVATGANVEFDGICVVDGYADASSTIQRGAGVLVYDDAKARFYRCIFEDNIAATGCAIATTLESDGSQLTLDYCVVNNNTAFGVSAQGGKPWVIDVNANDLTLNHVTIINNIGCAPTADVLTRQGNTSLAAGNMVGGSLEGCNNSLTSFATLGEDGSHNFSNPSIYCGAKQSGSGNVYYGGNTEYRPLTSSIDMQVVINKGENTASANVSPVDIAGNDYDLGGLPDLGAYEALLPRAGSVIYVRSYNTIAPASNDDKMDETDGAPDFELLRNNPSVVYNGMSWDNAIHGNAMCDTLYMDRTDNSFYVRSADGMLLATTFDNAAYSTYLGSTTTPVRTEPYYGPASGHYSRFYVLDWQANYQKTEKGRQEWDKYYQGNPNQWDWNGDKPGHPASTQNYLSICNDRKERYISGLQLAVEIAAKYNALHRSDADFVEKTVWVGAGVYTDAKGFVIRDGVKVYGGYPKTGEPGENDRKPLLSQYVPARTADETYTKADYETILQVRRESPVFRAINDATFTGDVDMGEKTETLKAGELWISNGVGNGSTNSVALDLINECQKDRGLSQRHYVLYQPDTCVPTWNTWGNGTNKSRTQADQYRYFDNGDRDKYELSFYWKENIYGDHPSVYKDYQGVKWDGFTVRHGYTINYMANRDGGAGVRVFRGVELENLIIVNNLVHGARTRGGGLYMDGDNSKISNSFLLNNLCTDFNSVHTDGWKDATITNDNWQRDYSINNRDNYGGGAYMIVGTGYNMVVAGNRCSAWKQHDSFKDRGGGIFIEKAKFYNNTVVYNQADHLGSGIEQWANKDNATQIESELSLYNCLVFGNYTKAAWMLPQISTTSIGTFHEPHNCLIAGGYRWNATAGRNLYGLVYNENTACVATTDSVATPANGNIAVYNYDFDKYTDLIFQAGTTAQITNDYRLKNGSPCLNAGTDDLNQNGETEKAYLPLTDMDYTNRVKDCVVDIGAYETDEYSSIDYELRKDLVMGSDSIVYYVTETGYGDRSGRNPDNAACAEKLQKVLIHAGNMAQKVMMGNLTADEMNLASVQNFVVKVAGYSGDDAFVYHANTQALASEPQSYTYVIPDGVTLMGGFYEGRQVTTVDPVTHVRTQHVVGHNWYDNNRNSYDEWLNTDVKHMAVYRTILSAEAELLANATVTNVQGFHAITFGSWPTDNLQEWSQTAIQSRSIVDGCFIIDGNASEDNGHKGLGGGAIVPANALVRNCVVYGNNAVRGGGLYLMPGALVAGTLVQNNTAAYGAGIYADNGDTDNGMPGMRDYLVSCTIVDNKATTSGGGLYMENGALMASNSVLWGNASPSDRNICGVVDRAYDDDLLYGADLGIDGSRYYPFNDCYVENYNVIANTKNTSMTSNALQYFVSEVSFIPRPYSPLVHNGVKYNHMDEWIGMGVPEYDMRSAKFVEPNGVERLTVGAFAVHTTLPSELFTRLFVSNNGGANIPASEQVKYNGRSFYTPFNSLDLALEYIYHMRDDIIGDNKAPLATKDTHFEILMSEGIYKPGIARQSSSSQVVKDQRSCTFSIPENVSVYGGFKSTDDFSCGIDGVVDNENHPVPLRKDVPMLDVLKERNDKANFADFNLNNILEPWELGNRTILSGDIQNSSQGGHVYHVVFVRNLEPPVSEATRLKYGVTLDGLDIIDGETEGFVDTNDDGSEKKNEVGHGGAIYSNGVNVTLNRCRLMGNQGIHGGAVAVENADLVILGSYLSHNRAVGDSRNAGVGGHGGAVNVGYQKGHPYGNFYTVGSIYVNNSAYASSNGSEGGKGGAVYVNTEKDNTTHDVHFMNCIVARNAADIDGSVFWRGKNKMTNGNEDCSAVNTVYWQNESKVNNIRVQHSAYSASDRYKSLPNTNDYYVDYTRPEDNVKIRTLINMNVALSADNDSLDGPHFKQPTTVSGYDGHDASARWNPKSITVLTDAGSGKVTLQRDASGKPLDDNAVESITGLYAEMWSNRLNDSIRYYYAREYGVDRYMFRHARDEDNPTNQSGIWIDYQRYLGGLRPGGELDDRTIDIGVYEYQYKFEYSKLAAVYIGMEEMGDGDGRDWLNQSTDLRNAIIAMANPQDYSNLKIDTPRSVFVRSGTYFSPTLLDGNAFTLEMNNDEQYKTKITLKGSCQGYKENGEEVQDFSKQTVIVPSKLPILMAGNLMTIEPRMKEVTIEGLTFMNDYGRGVHISTENNAKNTGSVTLRNCGLRQNLGSGLFVSENHGEVLIYNTLFDHNQCRTDIQNEGGDGANEGNTAALYASGKTTVVNCTFAENVGKALDGSLARTNVYNSVSWQNRDNKDDIIYNVDGSQTYVSGSVYGKDGAFVSDLTAEATAVTTHNNKAFAYRYADAELPEGIVNGPANDDIMNGPNFTNPVAHDYTLRPSFYLMDRGDNVYYQREVLKYDADSIALARPAIPDKEVDLNNMKRLVGAQVDLGAFELDVELRPIIYVAKDGEAGNTGESWQRAVNDLQTAVDLAGLYSRHEDNKRNGYVFVRYDVKTDRLRASLDGVHVYGNMNREVSSCKDDITEQGVETIVNDLLEQRAGTLERVSHDRAGIEHLTLEADVVVDGFQIPQNGSEDGSVNLQKGMLATSLVTVPVTGTAEGVLYNSLVYDRRIDDKDHRKDIFSSPLRVTGVRAVNVTATSTLEDVARGETDAPYEFLPNLNGSYANRAFNWKAGLAVGDGSVVERADSVARCHYAPMQYRNMQLNDDDTDNIDRWQGASSDAGGISTQYAAAQMCMAKVKHHYDVLGNERLRNQLDNGCFETWNVVSDTTEVDGTDWPRCPSVVYVRRGVEMKVDNPNYNLSPLQYNYNYLAFLLLEHHAGIRNRDNWLGVMHIGVERDLEPSVPQMIYLPFAVDMYNDADKLTVMEYDGLARAAYDYTFCYDNALKGDTTHGAWRVPQSGRVVGNRGCMIKLRDNVVAPFTIRFYDKQQVEHPEPQFTPANHSMSISQYNWQEPWTDDAVGGNRFTHKENMGWNIVGSPLYCSMNYSDMEYGRMVYWLDTAGGKAKFVDLNTDASVGNMGHIPPFDGVFTQTATLDNDNTEHVKVAQTLDVEGQPYGQAPRMAVRLSHDDGIVSRSEDKDAVSDVFSFNAVPSEMAHTGFDMSVDGVKWMADSVVQIYATSGQARYSTLGAVSEDGVIKLGVDVPDAGRYRIAIPEDVDTDGYEAVLLKDAKTRRTVNLLDGGYAFTTDGASSLQSRFSLSFKHAVDGSDMTITMRRVAPTRIKVTGLLPDDVVRAYLPDGKIVNEAHASQSALTMSVGTEGVVVVEVIRGNSKVCARKIR